MVSDDKIKKLCNSGYTVAEISKLCEMEYHTLYRRIQKLNLKFVDGRSKINPNRGQYIRKIRGNDILTVIKEYESGLSMKEIGTIHNVNAVTIFNLLKKNNVTTRLKNGLEEIVPTKLSKELLYELYYKDNLSLLDIAKKYDYPNAEGVNRDMRLHGIQLRDYTTAGKVYYSKPENLEKLRNRNREISRDLMIGRGMSDIEEMFSDWCDFNRIEYQYQYMIPDSGLNHLYDFYIPERNAIVEINGEYWHSSEDAIIRDKKYNNVAVSRGYKIFWFWGKEIKNNLNVFERIYEF